MPGNLEYASGESESQADDEARSMPDLEAQIPEPQIATGLQAKLNKQVQHRNYWVDQLTWHFWLSLTFLAAMLWALLTRRR